MQSRFKKIGQRPDFQNNWVCSLRVADFTNHWLRVIPLYLPCRSLNLGPYKNLNEMWRSRLSREKCAMDNVSFEKISCSCQRSLGLMCICSSKSIQKTYSQHLCMAQVGIQNWIRCPSTHVKTFAAAAATFPQCSECSSVKSSANWISFKGLWLCQWLCQKTALTSKPLTCVYETHLIDFQHLTSKFRCSRISFLSIGHQSDFHPLEVSWIRLRWCGTATATSIGSAQKLFLFSNPARSLAIHFHKLSIVELRVHEEKVILQVALYYYHLVWLKISFKLWKSFIRLVPPGRNVQPQALTLRLFFCMMIQPRRRQMHWQRGVQTRPPWRIAWAASSAMVQVQHKVDFFELEKLFFHSKIIQQVLQRFHTCKWPAARPKSFPMFSKFLPL